MQPTLIKQELQTIKYIKQHNSNYIKLIKFINLLCDDCHEQAVLISESHGDSNWCTPYRGKHDQHDTYASCGRSPYVVTFHEASTDLDRSHCSQEKRALDTIYSTPADRSAGPYPVSLPNQPLKQWGQNQSSIDGRLLGLPDPYHWHAIGTFNTCSQGLTHQSLINTGGGYHLGALNFRSDHSSSFPSSILHFPLIAPPGLQLCHFINYSSSQHSIHEPGYKSPKSHEWNLPLDFYRSSIH